VGSTLLEGSAMGIGQWLVLRRPLPQLKLRARFPATAVRALEAWSLAMIPDTAMSLAAESAEAVPPPESGCWGMVVIFAIIGLVIRPWQPRQENAGKILI
jgi:hypothetical protein